MSLNIEKEKVYLFLVLIIIYFVYFVSSLNFKDLDSFNEYEISNIEGKVYNEEKVTLIEFENSIENNENNFKEKEIVLEKKIEEIKIDNRTVSINSKKFDFFGFITDDVRRVLFFTEENDLSVVKKIAVGDSLDNRLKLVNVGVSNLEFIDLINNDKYSIEIEDLKKYKILNKEN